MLPETITSLEKLDSKKFTIRFSAAVGFYEQLRLEHGVVVGVNER